MLKKIREDINNSILGLNTFIRYYYCKILNKSFVFNFESFNYFINQYHKTESNERCIEIPIFKEIIKKNAGKCILEVGNVLQRYFTINHEVVDKYEAYKGVINQDILNYKPRNKYDLIVSISTLEHIGYDEDIKDNNKILKAVKKMKSLLKSNGELIISVPLGYNSNLDDILMKGKLNCDKVFYFERKGHTCWVENKNIIYNYTKYGEKYPFANALAILYIRK